MEGQIFEIIESKNRLKFLVHKAGCGVVGLNFEEVENEFEKYISVTNLENVTVYLYNKLSNDKKTALKWKMTLADKGVNIEVLKAKNGLLGVGSKNSVSLLGKLKSHDTYAILRRGINVFNDTVKYKDNLSDAIIFVKDLTSYDIVPENLSTLTYETVLRMKYDGVTDVALTDERYYYYKGTYFGWTSIINLFEGLRNLLILKTGMGEEDCYKFVVTEKHISCTYTDPSVYGKVCVTCLLDRTNVFKGEYGSIKGDYDRDINCDGIKFTLNGSKINFI